MNLTNKEGQPVEVYAKEKNGDIHLVTLKFFIRKYFNYPIYSVGINLFSFVIGYHGFASMRGIPLIVFMVLMNTIGLYLLRHGFFTRFVRPKMAKVHKSNHTKLTVSI